MADADEPEELTAAAEAHAAVAGVGGGDDEQVHDQVASIEREPARRTVAGGDLGAEGGGAVAAEQVPGDDDGPARRQDVDARVGDELADDLGEKDDAADEAEEKAEDQETARRRRW